MFLRTTYQTLRTQVVNNGRRHYQASQKIPDLTKDRYPIKRGTYNQTTEQDVQYFQSICGPSRVVSDDLDKYNIDFMGSVRGYSSTVLKPTSTEEVSKILKYCNEHKLAVCPQGGNTGLVGGSVPVFDEIVLSMELMNKIERIDEFTGILECEAGCILEKLDESVAEKGLRMPLDLGAKGSCQIGGNVSTNAGGLRLLRYGNLQGNVLGLEAVKADGTILNLMANLKKDNTGYHLKHMFIGSEGTLGIVTRVAIACAPDSKSVNMAFLGLKDFDSVLNVFLSAKNQLGEILSACEMMDSDCLELTSKGLNIKSPIENHNFYMILETSGSNSAHDEEKLSDFLNSVMEKDFVQDGIITGEPSKMKRIWQLREQVSTTILQDGYCFKYDISLPIKHFYSIVPVMQKRVGHLAKRVCGYGHIGDSNLHLNVSCREFNSEIYKLVEPFVYQYTSKLQGSVSAEHGIGFLKTKYLRYSKNDEAIKLMKQMKMLMDPNGILNPYKVLPLDE